MFCFSFYLFYMFLMFIFLLSFFGSSLFFNFYVFSLFGLDISFSLVIDFLSLGFFSCVSFISSIVFFYSMFYMEGTLDFRRFLLLVFLFVFSMFLLVFSGNFIVTMVGWDGLGLVSFCLVIFYNNSSSLESGLITVFSNRVGDVFFLLCFFFFFSSGSLSWDSNSFFFSSLFMLFIFFGAITKSAQVPFSAWLPAAMAAPTPVSSLVHSSTLVTAGVYVIIRFNYIFSFFYLNIFKYFFLFTMVLAGACAFVEKDLKKLVAMSTLSQLGMMMFIMSVGFWLLSFLHMIIHAFFKSMLFLSTGSLMGQMGGLQDSRFFGGSLFNYWSFLFFSVSSLCLSGFPFFLGFYSKDFIISSSSLLGGFLIYYSFLIGCFFTVLYSIRLLFSAYSSSFKFLSNFSVGDSIIFFIPVTMLFLKCWLIGGLFYWLFLSNLTFFFGFFDLLVGIFLLTAGLITFFFLRFSYLLFFWLGLISFLRWKSSSGSSYYFSKFLYSKFENSWMETIGGSGAYTSLIMLNSYWGFFYKFSLGILMILVFLTLTYIY